MAELTRLGLVLLTEVLQAFTNWMERKEQKSHEEHVAGVRADPAAHWLRTFGGTDKRTPTTPADSGSRGHE